MHNRPTQTLQELKSTCRQNEEAFGRLYRMVFKSRVTDTVVVGKDVGGNEKGGAALPVRLPRGRVLCGVSGKVGGDPP